MTVQATGAPAETLFRVLREPAQLTRLSIPELDVVVRTARRVGLLSRLAVLSEAETIADELPPKARELLAAARPVAEHHVRSIRFEVDRIHRALGSTVQPIILLKGAAYVVAGLPAGFGRLVSDVDILVPKQRIEAVESALLGAGWTALKLDPYDQRYYRQWMHELPPLQHDSRRTVLDVHHTILPETARLRPDAAKLFESAIAVDRDIAVLGAEDMVLHSATHLFADGDLTGGLRDLVDLDSLLRHFAGHRQGFWHRLVPRARELRLTRPLFYALRYCRHFLHTPVPQEAVDASNVGRPPQPVVRVMDAVCAVALTPRQGPPTSRAELAAWMLYVRSHWLRMPPGLLVRHLAVKALKRRGART